MGRKVPNLNPIPRAVNSDEVTEFTNQDLWFPCRQGEVENPHPPPRPSPWQALTLVGHESAGIRGVKLV